MSKSNVDPVPEGFSTATPHLVCKGAAEAMDFYKRAFAAEEMMRLPGPDGKLMHGCIRIGNSPIMLADEYPSHGVFGPTPEHPSPVTIHLCVPDVDAFVERAVAAGATLTMPVADMFWGDRYGQLRDPFGHSWAVATRIRDLSPEQIAAAMPATMGPQ